MSCPSFFYRSSTPSPPYGIVTQVTEHMKKDYMPQKFFTEVSYQNLAGKPLYYRNQGSYTCREGFVDDLSALLPTTILPTFLPMQLVSDLTGKVWDYQQRYYMWYWLTRNSIRTSIKTNVSDDISDAEAMSMLDVLRGLFSTVTMELKPLQRKRTSIYDDVESYRRCVEFVSVDHQRAFNPTWWWIYLNRKLSVLRYEGYISSYSSDIVSADGQVNVDMLVDFETRDEEIYYNPSIDHPNTVEYWQITKRGRAMTPNDWLYKGSGPMSVRKSVDERNSRKETRQVFLREYSEGRNWTQQVTDIINAYEFKANSYA